MTDVHSSLPSFSPLPISRSLLLSRVIDELELDASSKRRFSVDDADDVDDAAAILIEMIEGRGLVSWIRSKRRST